MDIETSEQLAFIPEQVESILMTVVDGILRTEVYLEEKVRGLPSVFNGAIGRRCPSHEKLDQQYYRAEGMGIIWCHTQNLLEALWKIVSCRRWPYSTHYLIK